MSDTADMVDVPNGTSTTVTPSSASSSSSGTFQLTPLYGCTSDGVGASAVCSILRLDDCTILLDLGWDERYDEQMISALQGVINEVDCVLITHPDVLHLGALPYAIGKLGLNCPIYATLPVWRNGQMFMYSAWQERAKYDPLPFSLDDIDKAFDSMVQLKYSETVKLKDKGAGIEITPSCAGHMLGGAFWHIKKDVESIIYAVDFNHAAERHLNGALLNAPQLQYGNTTTHGVAETKTPSVIVAVVRSIPHSHILFVVSCLCYPPVFFLLPPLLSVVRVPSSPMRRMCWSLPSNDPFRMQHSQVTHDKDNTSSSKKYTLRKRKSMRKKYKQLLTFGLFCLCPACPLSCFLFFAQIVSPIVFVKVVTFFFLSMPQVVS